MSKLSYIDYVLENDMSNKKSDSHDEKYLNRTHTEKMILMYVLKTEEVTLDDLAKKLKMSESAINIVLGKMSKLIY